LKEAHYIRLGFKRYNARSKLYKGTQPIPYMGADIKTEIAGTNEGPVMSKKTFAAKRIAVINE
jgi:hypothetical protein